VLVWLAASVLAAAVVATVRWWLRRVDSLGRSRPFPLLSVVVLVVAGVGLLVPVARHEQLEDRLSAAATALVGGPVEVRCQTAGQEFVDAGAELGYVRYGADGVPERATLLKRGPCRALARYLRSDREDPSRDEVVAVHVLAHEAMHMSGVTEEARAECLAVQQDARTARLLGASAEDAAGLAGRYWTSVYPRMPERYVSAECRPGGSLDQGSPDAPWSR
jgi:hypothetical protein